MMGIGKEALKVYAVVEMMGHRKVVGIISESSYGPGNLIRVDVLGKDGEIERTEHVGVGSLYCLTEVTEEVAKAAAASHAPKPSWAYGIQSDRSLPPANYTDVEDDDEEPHAFLDDDDDDDHLSEYDRELLGVGNR